jgi:hypothetical protein
LAYIDKLFVGVLLSLLFWLVLTREFLFSKDIVGQKLWTARLKQNKAWQRITASKRNFLRVNAQMHNLEMQKTNACSPTVMGKRKIDNRKQKNISILTKLILTNLFLTLLTLTSFGQKQRLVGDNSRFFCVADSINYFTVKNLVDSGVSQIMTFHYDYDNGRVPEAVQYIIWLDKEVGFLKSIIGCDHTSIKDSSNVTGIQSIFDFFHANRIDTITRQLEPEIWMSHDMGYYITVYLLGANKHYNIRNYERGIGYKTDGQRTDKKKPSYLTDPRVLWVNLFDRVIK